MVLVDGVRGTSPEEGERNTKESLPACDFATKVVRVNFDTIEYSPIYSKSQSY